MTRPIGLFTVVLWALATSVPGHAQNDTAGNCSPISSGLFNKLELSCPGLSEAQVKSLNDAIAKLQQINQLNHDTLAGLVKANASRSVSELEKLLLANIATQYETMRGQRLIEGTTHLNATFMLSLKQFPQYRGLVANKDLASWWLPSEAKWFEKSAPYFPQNSRDADLYQVLAGIEFDLHCFTGQQRTKEMDGPITSYQSLEATWKSAPVLSYTVAFTPFVGDRVKIALVDKGGQDFWLGMHGFKLRPKQNSLRRNANLISSVDLLGGVCFVAVRVGKSANALPIIDFELTILELFMNAKDRFSASAPNWMKITESDRFKIYRFNLGSTIDTFTIPLCVGCPMEW